MKINGTYYKLNYKKNQWKNIEVDVVVKKIRLAIELGFVEEKRWFLKSEKYVWKLFVHGTVWINMISCHTVYYCTPLKQMKWTK